MRCQVGPDLSQDLTFGFGQVYHKSSLGFPLNEVVLLHSQEFATPPWWPWVSSEVSADDIRLRLLSHFWFFGHHEKLAQNTKKSPCLRAFFMVAGGRFELPTNGL